MNWPEPGGNRRAAVALASPPGRKVFQNGWDWPEWKGRGQAMQLGINRLIRMESSVMELAGGGEGEGRRRGSNGAE